MGKRWDASGIAYSVPMWREVLRVLKPGGHLLAFGGTRTSHRMVCAIEDAGFDVRDSIQWIYGSGFPKSLDVSKAIDAAAGAEREVLVDNPNNRPAKRKGGRGFDSAVGSSERAQINITAPATPAARQWSGWGTALKPAHEPVCLARKPLVGTVAANVCEHGTGAINVDGCRVACATRDFEQLAAGVAAIRARGGTMANSWKNSSDLSGANPANPVGRWPPNVLLTHSADCRRVGTREVGTGLPRTQDRPRPLRGYGNTSEKPSRANAPDSYGAETVPAYACAPGCPVAELNRQSGDVKSGIAVTRHGGGRRIFNGRNTDREPPPDSGYTDAGTAARFFPQFEWQAADFWPFRYEAKASRAEREAGCDGLPARTGNQIRCDHPTVKPIDLMRWLVRLVTPPGGLVLDPFAGSGTTLIAAGLEGFRAIGLDLDPHYCEIARARVKHRLGGYWKPRAAETDEPQAEASGPRQRELFG